MCSLSEGLKVQVEGALLATLLFAAALELGNFVISVLPFDFPRHMST
jgi:hypothetical protein